MFTSEELTTEIKTYCEEINGLVLPEKDTQLSDKEYYFWNKPKDLPPNKKILILFAFIENIQAQASYHNNSADYKHQLNNLNNIYKTFSADNNHDEVALFALLDDAFVIKIYIETKNKTGKTGWSDIHSYISNELDKRINSSNNKIILFYNTYETIDKIYQKDNHPEYIMNLYKCHILNLANRYLAPHSLDILSKRYNFPLQRYALKCSTVFIKPVLIGDNNRIIHNTILELPIDTLSQEARDQIVTLFFFFILENDEHKDLIGKIKKFYDTIKNDLTIEQKCSYLFIIKNHINKQLEDGTLQKKTEESTLEQFANYMAADINNMECFKKIKPVLIGVNNIIIHNTILDLKIDTLSQKERDQIITLFFFFILENDENKHLIEKIKQFYDTIKNDLTIEQKYSYLSIIRNHIDKEILYQLNNRTLNAKTEESTLEQFANYMAEDINKIKNNDLKVIEADTKILNKLFFKQYSTVNYNDNIMCDELYYFLRDLNRQELEFYAKTLGRLMMHLLTNYILNNNNLRSYVQYVAKVNFFHKMIFKYIDIKTFIINDIEIINKLIPHYMRKDMAESNIASSIDIQKHIKRYPASIFKNIINVDKFHLDNYRQYFFGAFDGHEVLLFLSNIPNFVSCCRKDYNHKIALIKSKKRNCPVESIIQSLIFPFSVLLLNQNTNINYKEDAATIVKAIQSMEESHEDKNNLLLKAIVTLLKHNIIAKAILQNISKQNKPHPILKNAINNILKDNKHNLTTIIIECAKDEKLKPYLRLENLPENDSWYFQYSLDWNIMKYFNDSTTPPLDDLLVFIEYSSIIERIFQQEKLNRFPFFNTMLLALNQETKNISGKNALRDLIIKLLNNHAELSNQIQFYNLPEYLKNDQILLQSIKKNLDKATTIFTSETNIPIIMEMMPDIFAINQRFTDSFLTEACAKEGNRFKNKDKLQNITKNIVDFTSKIILWNTLKKNDLCNFFELVLEQFHAKKNDSSKTKNLEHIFDILIAQSDKNENAQAILNKLMKQYPILFLQQVAKKHNNALKIEAWKVILESINNQIATISPKSEESVSTKNGLEKIQKEWECYKKYLPLEEDITQDLKTTIVDVLNTLTHTISDLNKNDTNTALKNIFKELIDIHKDTILLSYLSNLSTTSFISLLNEYRNCIRWQDEDGNDKTEQLFDYLDSIMIQTNCNQEIKITIDFREIYDLYINQKYTFNQDASQYRVNLFMMANLCNEKKYSSHFKDLLTKDFDNDVNRLKNLEDTRDTQLETIRVFIIDAAPLLLYNIDKKEYEKVITVCNIIRDISCKNDPEKTAENIVTPLKHGLLENEMMRKYLLQSLLEHDSHLPGSIIIIKNISEKINSIDIKNIIEIIHSTQKPYRVLCNIATYLEKDIQKKIRLHYDQDQSICNKNVASKLSLAEISQLLAIQHSEDIIELIKNYTTQNHAALIHKINTETAQVTDSDNLFELLCELLKQDTKKALNFRNLYNHNNEILTAAFNRNDHEFERLMFLNHYEIFHDYRCPQVLIHATDFNNKIFQFITENANDTECNLEEYITNLVDTPTYYHHILESLLTQIVQKNDDIATIFKKLMERKNNLLNKHIHIAIENVIRSINQLSHKKEKDDAFNTIFNIIDVKAIHHTYGQSTLQAYLHWYAWKITTEKPQSEDAAWKTMIQTAGDILTCKENFWKESPQHYRINAFIKVFTEHLQQTDNTVIAFFTELCRNYINYELADKQNSLAALVTALLEKYAQKNKPLEDIEKPIEEILEPIENIEKLIQDILEPCIEQHLDIVLRSLNELICKNDDPTKLEKFLTILDICIKKHKANHSKSTYTKELIDGILYKIKYDYDNIEKNKYQAIENYRATSVENPTACLKDNNANQYEINNAITILYSQKININNINNDYHIKKDDILRYTIINQDLHNVHQRDIKSMKTHIDTLITETKKKAQWQTVGSTIVGTGIGWLLSQKKDKVSHAILKRFITSLISQKKNRIDTCIIVGCGLISMLIPIIHYKKIISKISVIQNKLIATEHKINEISNKKEIY